MQNFVRLRKKQIEVIAIQWKNNEAEIRDFVKDDSLLHFKDGGKLEVWNIENQSWITVPMFNFVVKGVKEELDSVSPEIIERTYDIVGD